VIRGQQLKLENRDFYTNLQLHETTKQGENTKKTTVQQQQQQQQQQQKQQQKYKNHSSNHK